jgi:ABC-type phosphate transport system ATPase subunit
MQPPEQDGIARTELPEPTALRDRQEVAALWDEVKNRLNASGLSLSGGSVEYGPTEKIFHNPSDPRTEAYVTGRVG